MERENESSPLLRTLSRSTKRNIFQRIPSEVAITGAILALFLIVVTLLLLLENLGSNSNEDLTLDSNLLASPLKYNKKATYINSGLDKDSSKSVTNLNENSFGKMRNWIDEWRDSYNVENFGDSLQKRLTAEKELYAYLRNSKEDSENKLLQKNLMEILEDSPDNSVSTDATLLGSPFKYNKKPLEKYTKNKKDNAKFSNKDTAKWDNEKGSDLEADFLSIGNFQELLNRSLEADEKLLDSWKKLEGSSKNPLTEEEFLAYILKNSTENDAFGDMNVLGSPFKYNKKAFDESMQNKKDFSNFVKNYNYKWNNAGKDGTGILGADLFERYLNDPKQNPDPEITLLGSPFKYNKKVFDKSWQATTYPENGFNDYKWDNVNKGWKKFFPLGSVANKENTDDNLQIKNIPIEKRDIIYDIWKKVSQKGAKFLKEFEDFNKSWKDAENQLKSENKNKEKYTDNGIRKEESRSVAAPRGCPFSNGANNLMQSSAMTEDQVNCALMAEKVRRVLGKCIDLSFLPKMCKPVWRNKCFSTYKYRKIDGSCNNQIHPTWGKSGTPFVRMMAPEYGDGVSSIRSTKNRVDLPNARFLSQKLYSTKMKPDIDASLLFLYFGLTIDHDMVETAINTENIPCCNDKFEKFPKNRPKECLEIMVSGDDPFYGPRNVKCLSVVRSLPVNGECVGRREQLNTATSLLDASVIYGSTIQKMKSLRTFNKGQLRTQRINKTPYMSSLESAGYNCGTPSEPYKCFDAGDSRVNMLVELTAMHTLWYREHNRLAEELNKMNPKWIDETLFQEARRILIAELQHITYKEFLPLLLGTEAMDFYQLSIVDNMHYDGYDDTIDPSVFNVFGAAAFRFGHSLAQDVIVLIGPDNKTTDRVPLHDTYFNPQILYHNGLDSLIRGSISQQLHSVDSFISKEVREHLFQADGKDFGHDLAAIGIQRGRDHGIPGYTKWRLACGLPEIKSWEDLKSVMNVERAQKLKEVYQFVEDIDLIPGALAEDHEEGSLLGPTHLCILGRQFKKTRKGDRQWFEVQDKIGSFSADQLKEIYKSNMARIVCDNSDGIQMIQTYPFKLPSTKNPVVECDETPQMDLSKWKAI